MVADRSRPRGAHGRGTWALLAAPRFPRDLALARAAQCTSPVDLSNDHRTGPAITFSAPGRDTVRIDPEALPAATSLTIGSHSSCLIRIDGPGVRALHAEIFWDGRALWVGPGMPGTHIDVDGGRLGTWLRIDAPSELSIGAVTAQLVPGPRDTILFDDAEATRIAPPDEADLRATMPYADDAPTLLVVPSAPRSLASAAPTLLSLPSPDGAPPEPVGRPMLRADLVPPAPARAALVSPVASPRVAALPPRPHVAPRDRAPRRDLSERPGPLVRAEPIEWSSRAPQPRADFRTPTPLLRPPRTEPTSVLRSDLRTVGSGFGAPPPEGRSALLALVTWCASVLRRAMWRLSPAAR
jgi:hypothetical protein